MSCGQHWDVSPRVIDQPSWLFDHVCSRSAVHMGRCRCTCGKRGPISTRMVADVAAFLVLAAMVTTVLFLVTL